MFVFILPRLRDMLFSILFVGVLLLGPRVLNVDGDLGQHIVLGDYILNSLTIPTHDMFSYTRAGQLRPPHEWGGEVLLALANRTTGLDGVVWLSAFFIAGTFTLVFLDAYRRSAWPLTAIVVTCLAAAASSLHWLPRPHLITFFLFTLWLTLLEQLRSGEKTRLWLFPLLMLIWANLHGGFFFGLLAWFAYFAGWIWEYANPKRPLPSHLGRQFLFIGVSSIAASLITPAGLDNWRALVVNGNSYLLSHTVETQPPGFLLPATWLVLFFLALSIAFLVVGRMNVAHFFLLSGLSALSLVIARMIPLFMIAAAPILVEALSKATGYPGWKTIENRFVEIQASLRGAVLPMLILLGSAIVFGINHYITKNSFFQFDSDVFPIRAVDWLESHPLTGNMFNDINWSGYLLYRLWPQQNVFIDSRTDFYGESLLREYEHIITASPDWDQLLTTYQVEWIIIPADAPLAETLRNRGRKPLYSDSTTVIYGAQGSP